MACHRYRAPGVLPVREVMLDNGLTVFVQEMHTAPLASVWCWYKVGSKDERAGPDRRVALGRAHELQGHDQHPARPGEGHHRAVRRQLERLHLDRPDDLPRNRDARRARPHAVHRGRAHGQRPLSIPDDCESERTVIISELQGGDNDPEQLLDTEVTAAAFKAHPLPPSHHRLAQRPRDDDARRPVSATTGSSTSRTTRRSSSSATSIPTTCSGASSEHFGRIPRRRGCPPRIRDRRARAAWRAPRPRRAARARPRT